MIRRRRIAVSLFFAVLTVALCVLWVRSYLVTSSFYSPLPTSRFVCLHSGWGMLGLVMGDQPCDWGSDGHYWYPYPDWSPTEFALDWTWESDPRGTAVAIPYWVPISLCVSVSVVPSIRWSRHFSLRTLFIAMTFVAVLLGLIMWLTFFLTG